MRAAWKVGLVLALTGAAPVFAAAAPEALASQAAGVVGSGDKLSLQLHPAGGAPARILKIGDVFEDGWVLTALDPTTATLTKGGLSRRIGLNPAGALAQPQAAAHPSQVTLAGAPPVDLTPGSADLALIQDWDGQPRLGLTLEETERGLIYERKLAAAAKAAVGGMGAADLQAALGEAAFADFRALARKADLADSQAAQARGEKPVLVLGGGSAQ